MAPDRLGDRGSVLLGTLMLVLVMTLLGLGLFQLGVAESRLVLDARLNDQALEIAEAGIDRGLHLLNLDFACSQPISITHCQNPPPNPSFQDLNIAGIAVTNPPSAGNCPLVFADGDTTYSVLKADVVFAGGTYTVCVKPSPANSKQAQLRARGRITGVITGTYTRTVEVTALATQVGHTGRGAIVTGGPAGGAITGNSLIAGSLQLVNCAGTGCQAVSFAGGGGMRNNYQGLSATINALIPHTFPDGSALTTLGAVLRVRQGQVGITSDSASVGLSQTDAFQDPLSGVFSSGTWSGNHGNCPPLNGGATTNNKCNVYTLASGPYPSTDATAVPLLSDSAIINGVGYNCFFLAPGGVCLNPGPVPGGPNNPEFFYTNSWRIDATRGAAGCDLVAGLAGCTAVLGALVTGAQAIDPGTGTPQLQITPAACARQGGGACTLTVGGGTLTASVDGNPVRPDGLPINVYVKGPVATSGAGTTTYTGRFIVLADVAAGTTGLTLQNDLLPAATVNRPWCTLGAFVCGVSYPGNHFLGLMTPGNVQLPNPGHSPNLIANLAAANNTASPSRFTISGQAQLAGTFSSQLFTFIQVPQFYQAPYNLNWLPESFFTTSGVVTTVVASGWREL
jgi:hypothetical protein